MFSWWRNRYRIGNYRLFYLIEDDKLIVAVVDFKHKQKAV